ncbi:MAG: leucine-rich repeat protein [Lachnospiraceae bacterium]|nr:leucine-rich repeat protein [Lachnospiraceae bacterium]
MPANAGHMSADFIKTEDVVKVSSDATKVKTADIEMNGNPIGFGNAKLIVDMAEPDDATKNAIASVVGTGEKTELSFEYVDLTLLQSVVKNYDKSKDMESQEAWDTQLTDLNSTVTIKLDLNDTLSAYDEGVSVVRVHDGKAETLDATVDGNSVAFSTDRFSTYAIVGKKKIMSEKKIKPAVVVDPTDPPASTVITDKDTQIEEKKDAKKEDTTNAKKKATSLKKGSKFSVTKNSVKINYIVTANLQVQVISVSNKKTVTIPATVKYDGFTYKVTSIGAEAFASKKKIAQVTIGSNIRRIGSAAFYNCKKLKKITFKGKYKKLTIGKYAFKGIHSGARIYIIKDVFAKYKKAIKNSVTSKIKYYKTK